MTEIWPSVLGPEDLVDQEAAAVKVIGLAAIFAIVISFFGNVTGIFSSISSHYSKSIVPTIIHSTNFIISIIICLRYILSSYVNSRALILSITF